MGLIHSSPPRTSIERSDAHHHHHHQNQHHKSSRYNHYDGTDNSLYPIDYTALSSAEELMQILRCPVCLEIPNPPIINCRKGHTICGGCLEKLLHRRCVICKAVYTKSRNFALESIVQTSKFVYHFELGENKCNLVLPGFQLKRHHADDCKFRHARIFSKSL